MMWLYLHPIYLNQFLLNTLPCLTLGGLIARMSWLPKSLNRGGGGGGGGLMKEKPNNVE